MSFKICMIGCGRVATRQHGPSCVRYAREHPDTQLVACCDLVEAKAIEFARRFGFSRHYTDFIQMLRAENPDAVTLSVPDTVTCELGCGVISLDYPLLTECPPGLTENQINRMIGAALSGSMPNQAAFHQRHMPLVNRLKQLLSERLEVGQIQHVRNEFTSIGENEDDLATSALHGIDTVRYLVSSDYQSARFHYQELAPASPAPANVFVDATFASGATAHLSFFPATGATTERLAVYAFDHSFFLQMPRPVGLDAPGHLVHVHRNQVELDVRGDSDADDEPFVMSGYYGVNAAFFDAVRQGRMPVDSLRSGRQAVALAQCLRERKAQWNTDSDH